MSRDDRVRLAHAAVPAEYVDPVTGGLNVPGYGYIPAFAHHRTERGIFAYGAMPGRPPMVIATECSGPVDDSTPLTLAELRERAPRARGGRAAVRRRQ